jgi:hypothetical protein
VDGFGQVLGGVPNSEQGLAASLFQTSFQVGGAVVLAIVTAVIDAGGAGRLSSPSAALAAYRPALGLITGVAAIGMLVALGGLRGRRVQRAQVQRAQVQRAGLAGDLEAGDRKAGGLVDGLVDELASGGLAECKLVGRPALQQAADVAEDGTEA